MINRKQISSLNDGVANICEPKEKINSFNAKLNIENMDDLKIIKPVFFSIESIRDQDTMYASSLGNTLSLKIKIIYDKIINIKSKVTIDNILYDIIRVDPDINNNYLYIYLESIGELCEKN